jgi:enoyl-CoA hydratase/carnithine racemase
VAVVVVRGEGRGFCSGGDVEDIIGRLLEGGDQRDVLEFTRMTGAVVQAMRELPKPIIAALNGVAAGAGAVIALASDFRLLARSASFRFLFSSVGLAGADMGCAWLLPRLVGAGRATEILMLGDKVTADDALAYGLANRVVDNEALAGETAALARRLADGPTFAYAATKLLLTREADMSLQAAIELEAWTQAYLMRSADHAEFFKAQAEKRPPSWTGR